MKKQSFVRVRCVSHLKEGNFPVDGKNIFQNLLPEVVAVMTRTRVRSKNLLGASRGRGRGDKYINKIHKYMFVRREIAFGDIYSVTGGES